MSVIEVHNPATGEPIETVPVRSADEVAEMVARAREVQPQWERLGFDGRAKVFRRARRWLLDHADEVCATIVAETGKAYEDALVPELSYGALAFDHWARHAERLLADQKLRTRSPFVLGRKVTVRFVPRGVVGVIGPWNYPLTNSFGDCIPALAAGNAVVLKPSQVTPLTSRLLERMLLECGMPDDVFQNLTGAGDTGTALIDNVDFVQFTGSVPTGRRIAARAAERLIPVSLELGGKDAMLVLADADVERAAAAAVHYSMQNAGQTCESVERVYVEEPVYHDFVSAVLQRVKRLRQGVPDGPGSVDLGAMTTPSQCELIDRQVADAVAKGAWVATGGQKSPDGRFFEPTVLLGVDHTMECMREETFGPTLPIMKVDSAEEAIRLANDSRFGLAAAVWTRDVERGRRIARRIEAGSVCINDSQLAYAVLEAPHGGWKDSGLGSRHGPHGIRKFCKEQTILSPAPRPLAGLHFLPYRPRRTRLILRAMKLVWGRGR